MTSVELSTSFPSVHLRQISAVDDLNRLQELAARNDLEIPPDQIDGSTQFELLGDKAPIGSFTVIPKGKEAEVEFWVDSEHRHNGYAKAALQSLLDYLKPEYHTISSTVAANNYAAIKVLEACGLTEAFTDYATDQSKFVAGQHKASHATELEMLSDRPTALKRCIVPLTALHIAEHIDLVRGQLERNNIDLRNKINTSAFADLIQPWLEDTRSFTSITAAMLGISKASQLMYSSPSGIGYGQLANSDKTPDLILTSSQSHMIREHTYHSDEPEKMTQTIGPTVDAQAGITAFLALPGYIAAKYDIEDPNRLLTVFNSMSLDEVAAVYNDTNFISALRSMSYAPNGTYAGTGVNDAEFGIAGEDSQLQHDVNEVIATNEYDRQFSEDLAAVTPIDLTVWKEAMRGGDKDKLKGVINAFTVYTLFTKELDGQIKLSQDFVKATRVAIRLESKYRTDENGLTPTIGCPAMVGHIALEEGDLTEDQLNRLMRGFNPVAVLDENNNLTIIRNPINETHKLHSDTITALKKLN